VNAKENALRIIRFDHPERVVSGIPAYNIHYHGCHHRSFDGGGDGSPVGSRWFDIWGTGWRKIHADVMGLPDINPLSEVGNLKSYSWPEPDDERICGKIYQMADEFPGGDWFLAGSHRDTLWEKSYMLVGMENMMMYFFTEPEFVREVLHRIMDFQLSIAEHYIKLGVEFASLGDDLGTQRGPLINPEIIDEFFVPEYERLFRRYRDEGVLIGFHSCGSIGSFMDMFMELGVDILNPIQATANDLDEIRAITYGRMALEGGVSSATIMAGPVDKIHAEVQQRLWQLGRNGGYFCRADQGMPYPKAHIDALYEAIEKYGHYPIAARRS